MYSRLILIISVVFYAISIAIGHLYYLSAEHEFWGFNPVSFDFLRILLCLFFVIFPATVLPKHFSRPSSLFLYALMFFVYVPAIVIALGNYEDSFDRYFSLLTAMCIGMLICCLCVKFGKASEINGGKFSNITIFFILILAAISFFILLDIYRDVLLFVGLDDIYEQREKGAATSLFVGYCQVYLAYIFAPILLSWGLLYKKYLIFGLAIAAFVFVYMITAERTILLLPVVLVGLIFLFKKNRFGIDNACWIFGLGGILILNISFFYKDIYILEQLGIYYFFRTIAIPGLLVSQYYDFFSIEGYTFWSHVSGIGSFVEVPSSYAGDPKWPALGKIFAERVLEIQSQSNANFIATDGVAALGLFGVVLIFIFHGFWLLLLDRVACKWDKSFILPALFPLAFVSTNGSFFTMMTSFGGIFWVVLLVLTRKVSGNSVKFPARPTAMR